MIYIQTLSKTSETTHTFQYGTTMKTLFFTAVPSSDYITTEISEETGKMVVNVRTSEWGTVTKSYHEAYRIFMNLESLMSYCEKFNRFYKQDNKLSPV